MLVTAVTVALQLILWTSLHEMDCEPSFGSRKNMKNNSHLSIHKHNNQQSIDLDSLSRCRGILNYAQVAIWSNNRVKLGSPWDPINESARNIQLISAVQITPPTCLRL